MSGRVSATSLGPPMLGQRILVTSRFMLALTVLALPACTPESPSGPPITVTAMDGPPPGAPSEFNQSPFIQSSNLDASFFGASFGAAADMRYFANRAEQTLDVEVNYEGSSVASIPRQSSANELFPWLRDLSTITEMNLADECGHTIIAQATHKAWHELSGYQWGTDNAGQSLQRSQLDCPPEHGGPPAGGYGGGGGGQFAICFYTIYYNTDTGAIISIEHHGCTAI